MVTTSAPEYQSAAAFPNSIQRIFRLSANLRPRNALRCRFSAPLTPQISPRLGYCRRPGGLPSNHRPSQDAPRRQLTGADQPLSPRETGPLFQRSLLRGVCGSIHERQHHVATGSSTPRIHRGRVPITFSRKTQSDRRKHGGSRA